MNHGNCHFNPDTRIYGYIFKNEMETTQLERTSPVALSCPGNHIFSETENKENWVKSFNDIFDLFLNVIFFYLNSKHNYLFFVLF